MKPVAAKQMSAQHDALKTVASLAARMVENFRAMMINLQFRASQGVYISTKPSDPSAWIRQNLEYIRSNASEMQGLAVLVEGYARSVESAIVRLRGAQERTAEEQWRAFSSEEHAILESCKELSIVLAGILDKIPRLLSYTRVPTGYAEGAADFARVVKEMEEEIVVVQSATAGLVRLDEESEKVFNRLRQAGAV